MSAYSFITLSFSKSESEARMTAIDKDHWYQEEVTQMPEMEVGKYDGELAGWTCCGRSRHVGPELVCTNYFACR